MSRWEATPQKSSLEAAAEAAAKVNAMLIAKGKLKPSQVSQPAVIKFKPQASAAGNPPVTEIDINDIPAGCRNMLTRGVTQDEISKMSGAAVSTRGRYMSPQDMADNPNERPIYLFIQGKTQDSVDRAVSRISEIISTYKPKNRFSTSLPSPPIPQQVQVAAPRATPLMSISMTPPPGMTLLQEKVVVGLEHAPPSFSVKEKIEGPGGCYLQHIATESGAKVSLRGRGSGNIESALGTEAFEPMFVSLHHPLMSGLQKAKQLTEDLLQTVHQEYVQFQQAIAAMPPPLNPGQVLTMQPQSVMLGQPPPGMPPAGTVLTTVGPEAVGGPPGTVELRAFPGQPGQVQQVTLQPGQVQIQGQPVTVPPGSQVTLQLQPAQPVPGSVGATVAGVPQAILSQPAMVQPQLVNPQGSVAVAASGSQFQQAAALPVISQTSIAGQPAVAIVGSQHLEGVPVSTHIQIQQDARPIAVATLPGPPVQAVGPGLAQFVQPGQPVLTQGAPIQDQPTTNGQPTAQSYYQKYINQAGEEAGLQAGGVSDRGQAHKRRFTEEKKEEKLPDNLLGYQHGPPHLANLVNNKGDHNDKQNEERSNGETKRPGEEGVDRTLMPPPPIPSGSKDDEKKLMPPPQLPGREEPAEKKAKGALGSIAVPEDEKDTEGSIKSTFKDQQKEASKYTFNQYSGKAQIYVANDQQPGPPELYQLDMQVRPDQPIISQSQVAQMQQTQLQGEQVHQLQQQGHIITEHPQQAQVVQQGQILQEHPQVVQTVADILSGQQTIQGPPPGMVTAQIVSQEAPPHMVTQQTVVFSTSAPPPGQQPEVIHQQVPQESVIQAQVQGQAPILVAEGQIPAVSLAVAGYSVAPPSLTSEPPPVYSVSVAPPPTSDPVPVYSIAPPNVSEPLPSYSASVVASQTSQPPPSYSVSMAPPQTSEPPPHYSMSVAQAGEPQPSYSVATSQGAQQTVVSQQSDQIVYQQPPPYPSQGNQIQQPPPSSSISTMLPPPPPPPTMSTSNCPSSMLSAPPPPPPPIQDSYMFNVAPPERPPFQQPPPYGSYPPGYALGTSPASGYPYWNNPPPPPPP